VKACVTGVIIVAICTFGHCQTLQNNIKATSTYTVNQCNIGQIGNNTHVDLHCGIGREQAESLLLRVNKILASKDLDALLKKIDGLLSQTTNKEEQACSGSTCIQGGTITANITNAVSSNTSKQYELTKTEEEKRSQALQRLEEQRYHASLRRDALNGRFYRLEFENTCKQTLKIAVYYHALDGTWVTSGWWNVPPEQKVSTTLTDNHIYYYYAHSIDYKYVFDGRDDSNPMFMDISNDDFEAIKSDTFTAEKSGSAPFRVATIGDSVEYGTYNMRLQCVDPPNSNTK